METQVHRGGAGPGERPKAQLHLYLLGRFEVVRADAPIPPQAWRRRRPADLLKLAESQALADGDIQKAKVQMDAAKIAVDHDDLHADLVDLIGTSLHGVAMAANEIVMTSVNPSIANCGFVCFF